MTPNSRHGGKRFSEKSNVLVATPANFTLKLPRPGFGPAAEPPAVAGRVTASRRLQFGSRGSATSRRQPPRRSGFGT